MSKEDIVERMLAAHSRLRVQGHLMPDGGALFMNDADLADYEQRMIDTESTAYCAPWPEHGRDVVGTFRGIAIKRTDGDSYAQCPGPPECCCEPHQRVVLLAEISPDEVDKLRPLRRA